jgi:hypothetical protein
MYQQLCVCVCVYLATYRGGGRVTKQRCGFRLEPGFIHFAYNHNRLQSLETVSSTACTNGALAVELVFLRVQRD